MIRRVSRSLALGLGIVAFAFIARSSVSHGAEPAGDAQVNKLVEQLASDDAFVRLKAARSLGTLGPAAQSALPALEKLAQDPDEDVRAVAKAAVQKIRSGAPGDADIAKLAGQLGDGDPLVRLKAAKTLGEKGPAAQSAVQAMKKLLEDPDEDVRAVAASAIKKITGNIPTPANTPADTDKPAPKTTQSNTATNNNANANHIQLVKAVSLFCKGYTDASGLRTYPNRRFFLVAFKNTAKVPMQVAQLKLTWMDVAGQKETDSVEVPGLPDPIPPGGQAATWFYADCQQSGRKWKVTVDVAAPAQISEEETQEFAAADSLRAKMQVVLAKPIRNEQFGLNVGETYTIRNPHGTPAKGVRFAIFGYDESRKLVQISVYHAETIRDGDTTLQFGALNPELVARSTKIAFAEAIADAEKEINVVRMDGEIMAVGVSKKAN